MPHPGNKLKLVKELASTGKYRLQGNAFERARQDFGWSESEIIACICKLKGTHCYNSEPHYGAPHSIVDKFRARKLYQGEDVYTHLYIDDDGYLVVNSFKQLNSERGQ